MIAKSKLISECYKNMDMKIATLCDRQILINTKEAKMVINVRHKRRFH